MNEHHIRAARHYFRGEMLAFGSVMCGGAYDESVQCPNIFFFDLDLDDLEGNSFTMSMEPGPGWDVLSIGAGRYMLFCSDCIARLKGEKSG